MLEQIGKVTLDPDLNLDDISILTNIDTHYEG